METERVTDKRRRLERLLDGMGSVLVALSGGVDSGLLLAVAMERLGPGRVLAVSVDSPLHGADERLAAARMAADVGAAHRWLRLDPAGDAAIMANTDQRCYLCKHRMLTALIELARRQGLASVAHGANADDLVLHRPGWRAAVELGVRAPLVEAGIGKAEVRALARQRGLANWNRPAMSCLATRIPSGTPITEAMLRTVEEAEERLRALGIEACRVRLHGALARIEVEPADIAALAQPEARAKLVAALRGLGLRQLTLDLEGYRPDEPAPEPIDKESDA